MINTNNLTDIWRVQHPNTYKYTWHSNTRPVIFSRLDYFLITNNLANYISKSEIKSGYNTDHSIITLNIDFVKIDKGPGVFKINNSILLHQEYQNIIRNCINDTVHINNECNPNTLWELIKGSIRNETIKYTTFKKRKDTEKEKTLTIEIDNLENKLINSNRINENNDIKNELSIKKQELNDLIDKKINGILIRSKANMVEHDEKNSKYFSNLEKKRAESKIITQLNINGNLTSNQSNIRKEQKKFYASLYSKTDTSDSSINFFDNNINKLNNIEKISCEGKLSEYECGIALKQMQNSKSPGSDGISTEFFKIFWQDLKTYYTKSINYSFEQQNLTDLQKQGLITLLPKPDKDLKNLSNWRPISLLNVDYKIATKSIANRIKHVLSSIISPSQTGFIKGRYIGENIRLICEILEHVDQNDLPSLMFFSDFEKAFDSLDHTFMFQTLRHFNFGDDLLNWTKLFYTDVKSCILNNGHMTDFFDISRGVRQGCPLSPYMFIICIELLSFSISNNTDIKGIHINNNEIKNTLFADDATFIIDGTQKSFETLINTLDNFSFIAGLKLNTSKCNILRAGSLKNTNITYLNKRKFTWSSEKAKALGITFHTNKELFIKENIDKKIEEFNHVLKQWQHRKMSLLGKITVIKSIALPKLIYPLTVLKNPSIEKLKQITKNMYAFIWDSKPEKIKIKHLVQTYQKRWSKNA